MLTTLCLASILAPAALAATPDVPLRPAHTYSIVARDPETGELGVAVQSHWFSVGAGVSWAEAGVGAVATQSFVEVSYGPLGLDLMRAGKTAPEALKALLAADAHPEVRQVAMVDRHGNVAVHTGKGCIAAAGNQTGEGYSVQANMMEKDTVWGAMAKAYEASEGDLAERLLAAMEAAQAEGGDIRGSQSAAILVVPGTSDGAPWRERTVDLRIEDHTEPLVEMRRLLNVHRAYVHMDEGDAHMTESDFAAALASYAAAAELYPEMVEIRYWQAITMASAGEVEASLPLFARVFSEEPRWLVLTPRLVDAGLLDAELLGKILAAGE
jgi:uncharacterized Ntn-hydrolase superfamily protein